MTPAEKLLKMFNEADFDAADMSLLRSRSQDQLVRPRFSREREAEREMGLPAPSGFRVGDRVRVLPDWASRCRDAGLCEQIKKLNLEGSTGEIIRRVESISINSSNYEVDFNGRTVRLPGYILGAAHMRNEAEDVLQSRIKSQKLDEYSRKLRDALWEVECSMGQVKKAFYNTEDPDVQHVTMVGGELKRITPYDLERDRLDLARDLDSVQELLLAIRSIAGIDQ